MSSNTKWVVAQLFVRASTSNGVEDSLYANSRMQVPVSVFIKAVVPGRNQRHYLTQAELDSIQLIDYDDPAQILSGKWTYTSRNNGFPCTEGSLAQESSASAEGSAASGAAAESDADSGYEDAHGNNSLQLKVYRVSTTSIENKNIGASIAQPDGTVATTCRGSRFDSRVALEGREPVIYTTDNVTVTREHAANGTFAVDWAGGGRAGTATYPWSQDNWYISTTQHDLHRADIYCFDATGSANGVDSDARLAHCFAKRTPGTEMKLFFIWDGGGAAGGGHEAAKTVGLEHQTTTLHRMHTYRLKIRAYADIKVNQKRGALCLTRLAFRLRDAIWGGQWEYDTCGFTLYDVYGNMGTFYARVQSEPYYAAARGDADGVVIGNANPDPAGAGWFGETMDKASVVPSSRVMEELLELNGFGTNYTF